jgi:hypothetical protein
MGRQRTRSAGVSATPVAKSMAMPPPTELLASIGPAFRAMLINMVGYVANQSRLGGRLDHLIGR